MLRLQLISGVGLLLHLIVAHGVSHQKFDTGILGCEPNRFSVLGQLTHEDLCFEMV